MSWKVVNWSQPSSLPTNSLHRDIRVVGKDEAGKEGLVVVRARYSPDAGRFYVDSPQGEVAIASHKVTHWSSVAASTK